MLLSWVLWYYNTIWSYDICIHHPPPFSIFPVVDNIFFYKFLFSLVLLLCGFPFQVHIDSITLFLFTSSHCEYTLTVQHYSYYQLPLQVRIDSTTLFLFPDCRLPLYRLHQSTKSKLKCVFEFQNGVGVLACTLYNIQIIINCNVIKN